MTAPSRVRECRLYRFTVTDPHNGYLTTRSGYIGETERLPIERLVEHLRALYPWGDTVVGYDIDPRVFPDKASVRAAELSAIREELPLYNDRGNEDNPDRIDYAEQVAQRWARDDAAGRPRWQPGKGQARRARAASRPRPVRVWRGWPRWVRRSSPWAAVWLVLAVAVWWRLPDGLGLSSAVWVSSGSASLAVGVLLPGRRRRRRR